MPPPVAVASVAPPMLRTALAAVPLPVSAWFSVICVALSTLATVVNAGTVTVPPPLKKPETLEPGMIFAVLATFVTTADPAATLQLTPPETTAPISISLSSTDSVFVLSVVVVPLIVRLPVTTKSLLIVVVEVPEPVAPMLMLTVAPTDIVPVPMLIREPLIAPKGPVPRFNSLP